MYAKFHGPTMTINDFKIEGTGQGEKEEKERVLHAKMAIFKVSQFSNYTEI